jgi:hypothetical protein
MTVYFIQKSGDDTQVKVGASRNLSARMTALGDSLGEIDLIGTLPGDEPTERMIHRLFDAEKLGGEWFRRSDKVNAFIAENFPIAVERYSPRPKGWKTGHEDGAVESDKAVAAGLLSRLMSGFPRTTTLAAALEEIYLQLWEINGVWTRRRVRAIHEGAARRIDLFEIKDMLNLLEIPPSEWGGILSKPCWRAAG